MRSKKTFFLDANPIRVIYGAVSVFSGVGAGGIVFQNFKGKIMQKLREYIMPTTRPPYPLGIFGHSYGPSSRTRQPPAWLARWGIFVVSVKAETFLETNI